MGQGKTRRRSGQAWRADEGRATELLREKLAARGVTAAAPATGAPEGSNGPKASDALLRVVEPLLDGIHAESRLNQQRLENVLQLGVLAWNAHSMGFASIQPFLRHYAGPKDRVLEPANEHSVTALLDPLLERRRALFGGDLRLLADFVVLPPAPDSSEFRIAVSWAAPESEQAHAETRP